MKVNNINKVLLIFLILTSCAPAETAVFITETVAPLPILTSTPPTITFTPTQLPETVTPTSEPIASLSLEGPWLVYRHNALSLGFADVAGKSEEFMILNQDGSGGVSITLPDCGYQVSTFLMNSKKTTNFIAKIGRDIYIIRPSQVTGLLVYRQL